MRIPMMLKNKWNKAPCIVFLNASDPDCVKAANMAVPVVPMLDPKKSGYTFSSSTRPMPTIGVTVEVNMELD